MHVSPTDTEPRPVARSERAVRTDIQGLRAIAVSLVLVYHLAPSSLTGGFTGVDVFFVISGFLITLHLLEHLPSRPRDLAAFWSRRVRRLLPASLLVLAATAVATRLVAPETQWATTGARWLASTSAHDDSDMNSQATRNAKASSASTTRFMPAR